MFEGTYNNFSRRPQKRADILKLENSFENLIRSSSAPEEEDILSVFTESLKKLLDLKSAVELIEGLHALEANIGRLEEKYPGVDTPKLNDFYQELSPIVLQKYWERRKNPISEESIDDLFLESIHIAIEEEMFIWQEKIN
jgi:hypothetical protein